MFGGNGTTGNGQKKSWEAGISHLLWEILIRVRGAMTQFWHRLSPVGIWNFPDEPSCSQCLLTGGFIVLTIFESWQEHFKAELVEPHVFQSRSLASCCRMVLRQALAVWAVEGHQRSLSVALSSKKWINEMNEQNLLTFFLKKETLKCQLIREGTQKIPLPHKAFFTHLGWLKNLFLRFFLEEPRVLGFLPGLGWDFSESQKFPVDWKFFLTHLNGKCNVGQIHHPLKLLEASRLLLLSLLAWSFPKQHKMHESIAEAQK